MWWPLQSGTWGSLGNLDQHVATDLLAMGRESDSCYKARHGEFPAAVQSRIKNFGKGIVGKPPEQMMASKGAESWGLLLFVVDCLNKKRGRLGEMGGRLHDAGSALCQMMHVFDRAGPRLTALERNQCWHFWHRYCTLTQGLPELHIPKGHLILHMLGHLDHRSKYHSS